MGVLVVGFGERVAWGWVSNSGWSRLFCPATNITKQQSMQCLRDTRTMPVLLVHTMPGTYTKPAWQVKTNVQELSKLADEILGFNSATTWGPLECPVFSFIDAPL